MSYTLQPYISLDGGNNQLIAATGLHNFDFVATATSHAVGIIAVNALLEITSATVIDLYGGQAYYSTENGNTVASNIVTEATGADLFPQSTTFDFGVPWNETKADRLDSTAYALGDEVNFNGAWYECTTAGTSDTANPFDLNRIVNGDFATDTDWTKEAGWTITGGKAVGTATTSNLYQASGVVGTYYLIEYTISDYVGGSVRCNAGFGLGTTRSANGDRKSVG